MAAHTSSRLGVAALVLLHLVVLACFAASVNGCPADNSSDTYYTKPGTYKHPDVPGLLALSCAFTRLPSFGADWNPCSQQGMLEQGLQVSCGGQDAQGRNRVLSVTIPNALFLPAKVSPSQLPSGWTFDLPGLSFLVVSRNSNGNQPSTFRDYFQDWMPVWRTAFPSLQQLNMQSAGASGPGWQGICQLPTLTSVYLSDNRLTGGLPACLSGLTRLTALDLNNNALTGGLPAQLGRSMQTLRVSNNLLVGGYPSTWPTSSPELRQIDLQNNQFNGGLPASWHLLIKIEAINFSGNLQRGKLPMTWRKRFCLHKPDNVIYFGKKFQFAVLSNYRTLSGNACANPDAKRYVMIAWLAFAGVATAILSLMFLELGLRRGQEQQEDEQDVQAYPMAVSSPPGGMKEISLQSREFRMEAAPTHVMASAGGPPAMMTSPRLNQKRPFGRLYAIVDGPSRFLTRATESHVWHAMKVLVSMVDIVSDVLVAVNIFPRPIFAAMVFSIIFPDLVAASATHIHWVRCARRHPAAVQAPRWAPYRLFAALPAALRPLTLLPALPFLLPYLPLALLLQLGLNVAGSRRRVVDALDATTYLHVYSWMVALVEAPIQTALVSWFFVQGNTVQGGYYTSTVIFVTSIATSLADMAFHLIKARNLVYEQGTLRAIPSHFRSLIHEMGHPSQHFRDSDRPPGAGRDPSGHQILDPFPDTPPGKGAPARNFSTHYNSALTSNDDIYANPIHSASFSKPRRGDSGNVANTGNAYSVNAGTSVAKPPSRTASWVSSHSAAGPDTTDAADHLPLRSQLSSTPPPRTPPSPPRLRTPRLRPASGHRPTSYKAFVAESLGAAPPATTPSPEPLPASSNPPRRHTPPEAPLRSHSSTSSSGGRRSGRSHRAAAPTPTPTATPLPSSTYRSASYRSLNDAAAAAPLTDVDLHRSASSATSLGGSASTKYRSIDEALAMAASSSFRSSQGGAWQR